MALYKGMEERSSWRHAPFFDPRDYGTVDPTGRVDSAPAYNAAAVAAARAAILTGDQSATTGYGATVPIIYGKGVCKTPIVGRSGVLFEGEGEERSELIAEFSDTTQPLLGFSGSSETWPRGGGVTGVKLNADDAARYALSVKNWDGFDIRNVRATRAKWDGIYLADVTAIDLHRPHSYGNWGNGLRIIEVTTSTSTTVTSIGGRYRLNGESGIICSGSNLSFYGGSAEGNGTVIPAMGCGVQWRYGTNLLMDNVFMESNPAHDYWLSAQGGGGGACHIRMPRFSTTTKQSASYYKIFVDAADPGGGVIDTYYQCLIEGGDFNFNVSGVGSVVIAERQLGGVTINGIKVNGDPPQWLNKLITNYPGVLSWWDSATNTLNQVN